ncbi:hypothetical protein [Runella sp.]|uniref:hypothetical protein n=1 Tax=Runella sp. TaxID=1960881 RepID=UPI003D0E2854
MKNTQSLKSLIQIGAIAGMASIISYLIIAFFDLPNAITFLLAMLFPMLGIVAVFSLKEYITDQLPSYANSLSFTFGSIAFTICAIFLSAQLAVQIEVKPTTDAENQAVLKLIKASIRVVDMGMDVAWDMFIGTYLLLFLFSTQRITTLKWWGLTGGILGIALMILNVYTFPIPPANSGLFDLGPFIALFLFALHVRMFFLGRQMQETE